MARKLSRSGDPSLTKAIVAAGGVTALARALGIDPAAVSRWTSVPFYRALEVERITKPSADAFRPPLKGGAGQF